AERASFPLHSQEARGSHHKRCLLFRPVCPKAGNPTLFVVLASSTITNPVTLISSILSMSSMKKAVMRKHTLAVVLALALAATGLSACGSSSGSGGGSSEDLTLVAYSTPQAAFEKLIPAFQATPEGKGVS